MGRGKEFPLCYLHEKRASRVDLVHEVESLHRCRLRTRQVDGARIVDDNVDAAKLFHSLLDGALDAGFVANINNARQSLTPGRLNCSEQYRHLYGPNIKNENVL